MSEQPKPPVTQRAYTLRLRGINPEDDSWRDALWATHEAVNKGAKAFGDWLLTLCGGLDHRLALDGNTKERRVVLALGWLSVEDAEHAPAGFKIAAGTEPQLARSEKVLAALRDILVKRGIAKVELDDWVNDCKPSLCSAIREDAIWVNRSDKFDCAVGLLPALTRDQARKVLEDFVGGIAAFLSLPAAESGDRSTESGQEDESKDFVQKAGCWLSFNLGDEEKSDKATIARNLEAISTRALDNLAGESGNELLRRILSLFAANGTNDRQRDLNLIRDRVGWLRGPPSKGLKAITDTSQNSTLGLEDIDRLKKKLGEEAAERRDQTGELPVPWATEFNSHVEDVVGFKYAKARYAVMLDHALRRFSSTHTWVKRAEAKRRLFEKDAAKITELRAQYADATAWLDDFCERRSLAMGTATDGGYRIRRRALGGKNAKAWRAVVQAWSRDGCGTEQDRIEAVHEVQSEWDEDEKFGHADLFEQLADDNAVCIWQDNGVVNPEMLVDYVAATTAAYDRQRFKVPMYRHPDALKHPVFCDFGNSRWSVHFEAQKAGRAASDTAKRRTKHESDLHALTLQLLASGNVKSLSLRWSSKRLDKDLAIKNTSKNGAATPVSRADRLGLAVTRTHNDVEIMNVYGPKPWNGRLQAPRRELERVARLIDKGQAEKVERAKRRLHWLLTFSPQLQPQGPWIEYGCEQGIYPPKKEIQFGPKNEKDEWRGLAYPIWNPAKGEGRKGLAKHILSQLSRLRVLSIDLGHRFAAACAVWETLSAEDLHKTVDDKKVIRGGVGPQDLYAQVDLAGQNGKARTEVYRRIGTDVLPDGTPHPAPWARLERQFLIKLQGEERSARAASRDEADRVRRFAERHGLALEDDRQRGRGVDELMSRTVRLATLALRRHARRAKIAWALDPATQSIFGMGGTETAFKAGDEAHVKLLTDAMFDWHALASETKWDDSKARQFWNAHVAQLPGGFRIEEPKRDAAAVDERTRQQRRKDDENLRERLRPIAEQLGRADRAAIHGAWGNLWQGDDGYEAKDIQHVVTTDEKGRKRSRSTPQVPASGWYAELRWLTDWIMGWHLAGAESKMWTRNVGGLSLTRIATMRSLYQLHKAFAMRARPDKPRGAPEKGESNVGVAQRLLNAMERMREQRVKQLASRIAASALGLGGHWKRVDVPKRDAQGNSIRKPDGSFETKERWVWVEEPTPKYEACHAVVIENLTNYRPDELQTRRENRQLMSWSSSKVKKYLAEACQLHGLHLREVFAAYTSRQDSRTGMPGVRCADVSVKEFLSAPWWRKQVKQANKKGDSERSTRDNYLLCLHKQWSGVPEEQRVGESLRIPTKGGDVFVSAADVKKHDGKKPSSGIQADLNAAANIGLKALTDPDWPGRWWYVPCNTSDGRPAKEKVAGCPIIPTDKSLRTVLEGDKGASKPKSTGGKRGSSKSGGPQKEIVNTWRDPSAEDLAAGRDWQPTKDYWKHVEGRVVAHLRQSSSLKQTVDTATPW